MIILQHFPVLPVVIPLILAPLCALFHNKNIAWLVAFIGSAMSFGISLYLLTQVADGSVISYALGGWAAPMGIEYRIDILSAFMLVIVSGIATIMLPYAPQSLGSELSEGKISLLYVAFLLCLTGLLGIISTNDVFNIYVFLEISSLSMYALIAMGKTRQALTASFEYLILGTIGATFFLIGVGLLYVMTGTLNLSDMAMRLGDVQDLRPVHAAFAFILLGLALKIALFPLHIWLTNAYAYAPSFISAFLAATATKVGLYLMIRMIYGLFGYHFSLEEIPLSVIFILLGSVAVLIGSLAAIYRFDAKRMLAFSSVAQIGYIVIALGLATEMAMTAGVVHIANHALTKGALFLAVGCVAYRTGGVTLNHFHGIGKQMPWTMAAFLLAGLSLIGVPLTAGFISKWALVQAMLATGVWSLIFIVILGSILAVIYIWKVIEVAYFHKVNSLTRNKTEAPFFMLLPLWTLVILNIIFGIYTEGTLGISANIARYLMGGI